MVAVWLPQPLADALDAFVQVNDLDRSKVIRQALRMKLECAEPSSAVPQKQAA